MGPCTTAIKRCQQLNQTSHTGQQSKQMKSGELHQQGVQLVLNTTLSDSPSHSPLIIQKKQIILKVNESMGQPQHQAGLSKKKPNTLNFDDKNNTPDNSINKDTNFKEAQNVIYEHLDAQHQAEQFKLQWDKTTAHTNCYQVKQKQINKTTLKYRDTEFNRCQITTKNPFPNQGVHILNVKIVTQQPKRAICIGLIAESRRYLDSSGDIGDKDSLGYWNFPQGRCEIDVDGNKQDISIQLQNSLYCKVGCQIKFQLDMNHKQLKIMKDNFRDVFGQIKLPDSLKTNKFYVFVSMIQKDDQIQIRYNKRQQEQQQKQVKQEKRGQQLNLEILEIQ